MKCNRINTTGKRCDTSSAKFKISQIHSQNYETNRQAHSKRQKPLRVFRFFPESLLECQKTAFPRVPKLNLTESQNILFSLSFVAIWLMNFRNRNSLRTCFHVKKSPKLSLLFYKLLSLLRHLFRFS